MKKIVLRGYYGFGNLGDDILMISCYAVAKKLFPHSSIHIVTAPNKSAYISTLCKDATVISGHVNMKADWTIFGGGGVYFDFEQGSVFNGIINRLISILGFVTYAKLYRRIQSLRKNEGVRTNRQAGLGIGIGTFTPTSKKFYSSILSLASFDVLYVRDQRSLSLLRKYRFLYPTIKATDLAFYYGAWRPVHLSSSDGHTKRRVAFILRDWKYDDHDHVKTILKDLAALDLAGFSLSFFSFDRDHDRYYLNSIPPGHPIHVWDPETCHMDKYLSELAAHHIVVSSRAHGAILSACLGVPGICLNIEPKLETVAAMLPTSYSLIEVPRSTADLILALNNCFLNLEQLRLSVRSDVSENAIKLEESLQHFSSFIQRTQS